MSKAEFDRAVLKACEFQFKPLPKPIRDPGLEAACLFYGEDDLVWEQYADWLLDHGAEKLAELCRMFCPNDALRVKRWLRLMRRVHLYVMPPKLLRVSASFFHILMEEMHRTNDVLGQDITATVDTRLRFQRIPVEIGSAPWSP